MNPPLAGLSGIAGGKVSRRRTGWLGREDSNLRMVESKSSDGGSLGTSRTSWTQVSCNKSGGDTVATRLKSKKAAPNGGF